MKKYTTWLKAAAILQLITAAVHAVSLFVTLPPKNDTEKQLIYLMDTYRFDLGAGFHRTMGELEFVLSACLCLVCLLGSMINWQLLRKKAGPGIMLGIININLIIFGVLFGLTIFFAFLEPIVLCGLIFLSLLLSRFSFSRE